ncbi:MAG: radical SAM protein [Candidatus Bathyarchaeia archaeon]|jgi:anaerobic magnesium-protoporphyrin IX monomethyl ester cyclase
MTTVTLVYPYFKPRVDTSIFRFPPLGLGYIAAYLKQHDISVEIVDCTFLNQKQALKKIIDSKPRIIGIQSMYSMRNKSLELARLLRGHCELLIAGGALPTTEPEVFLKDFDVAVIGEGEQTMLELVNQFVNGGDFSQIKGIVYKDKDTSQVKRTSPRGFVHDLDRLPPPARDLFDNYSYKKYFSGRFGYKTSAIMTSRGCPFACDFCSRPVFGDEFRARSASKVADEIEEVISLGYNRIWFADDCFTLNRKQLIEVCDEIIKRGLKIGWECLSRVDTLDSETADKMKQAGCVRMFFGIESGNDSILKIMNKHITTKQAYIATQLCKKKGIKAGAFFILGYPGENDQTILSTVKFASSLPLDYLSFTLPYPIPGTPLFERLSGELLSEEWEEPKNIQMIKHKLLFDSQVSEFKLKFAVIKGMIQFYSRKYMGEKGYAFIGRPIEAVTDAVYGQIK